MASRAQHYLMADRALARLTAEGGEVSSETFALLILAHAVLATVDLGVADMAATLRQRAESEDE